MDDALTKRCVIALIFIKRLNDLFYDDKTELVIGMPLSFGSRIDGVRPYSIDDVVKVQASYGKFTQPQRDAVSELFKK